jgi:hypothetical protein
MQAAIYVFGAVIFSQTVSSASAAHPLSWETQEIVFVGCSSEADAKETNECDRAHKVWRAGARGCSLTYVFIIGYFELQ